MDYSIHDAIEAGFNKMIFVIRKDIETDFRERIGNRVESMCKKQGVEIAYAFQNLTSVPEGFSVPEGRTKPWGTRQAVLAAKDIIHEPFAPRPKQDVVPIAIVPDHMPEQHTASQMQNAYFDNSHTIEVAIKDITIKIR